MTNSFLRIYFNSQRNIKIDAFSKGEHVKLKKVWVCHGGQRGGTRDPLDAITTLSYGPALATVTAIRHRTTQHLKCAWSYLKCAEIVKCASFSKTQYEEKVKFINF